MTPPSPPREGMHDDRPWIGRPGYDAPGPPQSAEGAYGDVGRRFRDYIFQFKEAQAALLPVEVKWVQDTEAAVYSALDACIRAVLRERGHALGCYCTLKIGGEKLAAYADPRCAPPVWLKEEVK